VTLTRVIGLGAEDRGDDGAGLLVARLLRAVAPAGVEVHECAGDAGALIELLDHADRVVLVDAAGGGQPGAVQRLALGSARPAPARSTHGLGLAEALAVASALDLLPAETRLYVVHGRNFDRGPVSAAVAAGVRAAAELILRDELGDG